MQFTPYVYKLDDVRVIDGDTFGVIVDLGFRLAFHVNVRLADVNTPEIRGAEKQAGIIVKLFVQEWVATRKDKLLLRSIKLDKYADRVVGDLLTTTGESLIKALQDKGYVTVVTKDGTVSPFTAQQLETIANS